MKGAVYVNGTITPADQAVIPVYDHGFVYGEGVYETLRTYNRVPFLYDRHMRRLRASAAALHLDVPFDDDTLRGWIDDTMAVASRLPDAQAGGSREAYIRILLTRGVGELSYDLKATPAPSLVIIVKPFDEPPARMFDEGIKIVARVDPAQPSGIGEPDHQVEQPAQQRHRHAGGASQGRRRGADVQLPRRAVGVLAVELLPRARRRGADAAGRRQDCSRASRAGSCSRSGATSACAVEEATLRPEDLATGAGGVHHRLDARADAGRAN